MSDSATNEDEDHTEEEKDHDEQGSEHDEQIQPKAEERNFKYGIIYLSYIPEGLNVKLLREIMDQFGEVGRVYLEAEKSNKKYKTYTEGWVEFKKKRVAKAVAKELNGKPLQYGRKHCKMNGQIWSIMYLHRFKWVHLTDQIIHNKAVREKKRRLEMSRARKQGEYYQNQMEKSHMLKKRKEKQSKDVDQQDDGCSSDHNKSFTKQYPSKVDRHRPAKRCKKSTAVDKSASIVEDDLLNNIFKPL